MNIHNMLRNIQICLRVALIKHNEEQIKPTHNRSAHSHIGAQGLLAVVSSPNGVSSSENRRTRVQSGVDTSFRDGDGLLFHGFVDGYLV